MYGKQLIASWITSAIAMLIMGAIANAIARRNQKGDLE